MILVKLVNLFSVIYQKIWVNGRQITHPKKLGCKSPSNSILYNLNCSDTDEFYRSLMKLYDTDEILGVSSARCTSITNQLKFST